jgi:hypothetical protein
MCSYRLMEVSCTGLGICKVDVYSTVLESHADRMVGVCRGTVYWRRLAVGSTE